MTDAYREDPENGVELVLLGESAQAQTVKKDPSGTRHFNGLSIDMNQEFCENLENNQQFTTETNDKNILTT